MHAQMRKVEGRIIDSNKEPLIGVSVRIEGTTRGTVSDFDGRFSIDASEQDVLLFTYIGYIEQKQKASNTSLAIILQEDTQTLDELIVIGYGTVKKTDLSGSVSQVSAKDIAKMPSANLSQALQGASSGLWTNENDRSPGAEVQLQLRGSNSFGGNAPLIIVDGFPLPSSAGMSSLNVNDIEAVSILKDASSTAIYGARAANGVILVTTKSGKVGKESIEISIYNGFRSFGDNIEMMDGASYAQLRREAYANDGNEAVFLPQELASLQAGAYTDWWDLMSKDNRLTQNYQLSFSGGNERTKVLVSGSFFKEDGIINNTDFIRATLRANIDQKIGKGFLFSSRTNLSLQSGKGLTGESQLYPASVGNPLSPLRDANGEYYTMMVGVSSTPLPNPVAYNEGIKSNYTQPLINTALSLEYQVMDGFKIKTQLSGEIDSWKQHFYVPIALSANHTESGRVSNGFAQISNTVNYNWISETFASYNKDWGKHGIDAIAGFSAQANRWESVVASASGFSYDLFETNNLAEGSGPAHKPGSDLKEWSMMSYFTRAVYRFNDRYIFTGNVRADGSSRFGANNKWGYFPSAAFAWKAGEEDLVKNIAAISDLKFRASYGLSGNANAVGIYVTQPKMARAPYNWGGLEAPGYYTSGMPAPNLKWETTKQLDLGLDFSLFSKRLNVAFDYYIKNTHDLIREIPMLAVSGFGSGLANMGSLRNTGVELNLQAAIVSNHKFSWISTLNLSHNKNKLTSLGDGTQQIGTEHWVGRPIGIGSRYMVESDGIWQTNEAAEAAKYGNVPGDVKYVDVDKNYKIDDKDRQFIGNYTPNLFGSLTNAFAYKGFDLNIFVTFEQGRDVYNGSNFKLLSGDGIYNNRVEMNERWTPTNPSNKYPRASKNLSNRMSFMSTEFLEDASFIKLKNLTIGYTLPQSVLQSIGVKGLRLYATGSNLLILTKFTGTDPEDGDMGNTARSFPYPSTKMYTFGLNMQF
ncbi:SusC/RagA family TonB-linked outer membrane protein [Bacteroidales bacterium]|nr:SusC/RagA family TonB-linked outer membrane protein [Bacteroidales bacterium]